MANTVGTNLKQNTTSFTGKNVFLGPAMLDEKNIAQWNPLMTGRGIFLWTKMPIFMQTAMPDETAMFKDYTQKGFRSFDGIGDLQAAYEDMGDGTAGNTFGIMTNVTEEFREFSMKVWELSGSPISRYMEMWLRGIYDPKTDCGDYLGLISAGTIAEHNPQYHTGEGIYMTFDPTMLSKGIEYAALITNITPTAVPKGHRNTEKGQHSLVDLDLRFSGFKYETPSINAKAKELWTAISRTRNSLDLTF